MKNSLNCPFVFASAKQGFAKLNMDDESDSMQPINLKQLLTTFRLLKEMRMQILRFLSVQSITTNMLDVSVLVRLTMVN